MSSRPLNALPDRQILNNSYRIKRCLTAGGFGITYIVEDSRGVEYVVKEHFPAIYAERDARSGRVVPKADQLEGYNWSLNAFRTEAEQLSVLNHPNIVSLIDAFDENDTAYYVMPFITGGDLTYITKSLIANGDHLTQAAVLKLLRSLLGALQHMHSRRLRTTGEVIYHFDIKPANVLLGFSPDGRDVVPTFIDFGSPSMGTPGYMPHEQRHGTDLGPWSDIYALGATMHRLLTGVAPPSHLDDENNPLPSAPPRDYLSANEALLQCYDSDLLESIDRSLEWDPYNRFASAEEWLAVLSDIPLRFPDTGSKLIDYARTSEPVREEDDDSRVSPLVIAACALLLAGVLGAYVYFFVSGDESDSDYSSDYTYSGGESTFGNEVANDYTPDPVNDPLDSHKCPGANSTDRTATEQGAELGCSTCQSRLSEMKNHERRCPGANSTNRTATEQGAALGCSTCQSRLSEMKNHERRCPGANSTNRTATEQGAELGCSTCQSRLSEMKEHENHCPGANSTNRTATEQGAALGCSTCKSRLAQISDHSCPGAASADRSAVESGAALGCATCQSRLSEMKEHENHCPGANSTNRTATEQGAALGCSTCKSRLAQISDHSCPGTASADRSAVESGAALGCATCQSRLSEMKDHENHCPGANSTDRTATEQGAALGCSTCKSRLAQISDHSCPGAASADRSAVESGAALGCATCQSRLSEMKDHENHCPGANSTDRTATEQGAALGCSTCKSRLENWPTHDCPGEDSSDQSATRAGADAGCATCAKRWKEMQRHKCPGAKSTNKGATENGAALGCSTCAKRLKNWTDAPADPHKGNKCPGKYSSNQASTKAGADAGCATCAKRWRQMQNHKCPGANSTNKNATNTGAALGCSVCVQRKKNWPKTETTPKPPTGSTPKPPPPPPSSGSVPRHTCPVVKGGDMPGGQTHSKLKYYASKGCSTCRSRLRAFGR